MRITQADIDAYRSYVHKVQDDAVAYVKARLITEAKGLSVADARNMAIEILRDASGAYGDKAQVLAAELFDEICELEGIDANPALIFDDLIDERAIDTKVRYFATHLNDNNWDMFEKLNAELSSFYVHKSALDNMVRNCYLNHIRYARVGTGKETCGYCFMLSSRGFVYKSKQAAEAGSHHNCDCIIVPGDKDKTKIDGYDPSGMTKRFKEVCRGINKGDKKELYKKIEKQDTLYMYRGVMLSGRENITGKMTDKQAQAYVRTETQSKALLKDKQDRHRGYDKTKSIVYISDQEIENIIAKKCGKGKITVTSDGRGTPQIKETIDCGKCIGESIRRDENGNLLRTPTNFLKIHYSKSGVHAVPFSREVQR